MRLFELTEGRHDPHTHKAIFMLGGPGSGKTYVAKKLAGGTGLRTINVDEFYEMLRNQKGIQGQGFDAELYKYSGNLSQKKFNLLLKGRIGLIIDGTGRKIERLSGIKDQLESLGYDTMAVFVNTEINKALDRNDERRRKVNTGLVRRIHADLKQKLGKLQAVFNDFLIIDNTNDNETFDGARKKIDKFLSSPNSRPVSWPMNEDESTNETQYESIAKIILTRAKPFIDKVGNPLKLAYRGYKKSDNSGFIRDYRYDRMPKDTGNALTDLANLAIHTEGGVADRSNSIFVSGDDSEVSAYGNVFVIFPLGDFNYTYHKHLNDFYEDLAIDMRSTDARDALDMLDKTNPLTSANMISKEYETHYHSRKPGETPLYSPGLISVINAYIWFTNGLVIDQKLSDGLWSTNEILISCTGGYLYVPIKQFEKYVAPILENNHISIAY